MNIPRWILSATALLAGFAVMSLELLGSRLVAPYLGSSILIWTNLIGVVLVALAAGAWLGGVVADRGMGMRVALGCLVGAGIWCLGLPFLVRPLFSVLGTTTLDWSAPLSALCLLAIPAFLLGTLSPIVVRASVADVAHSGRTVGIFSALGTVGSLLGTYVTGYVLLPLAAVSNLLFLLGVFLFALAAVLGFFSWKKGMGVAALLFALGLALQHSVVNVGPPGSSAFFPSAYAHVSVVPTFYRGERVELLRINRGTHSGATPERPTESVFEYVQGFRVMPKFRPQLERALVLGGGGFHSVQDLLKEYPKAKVDAVEIDPAVVEAARAHFALKNDPRLTIYTQDARPVLSQLQPGYDLLIQDAYSGDTTVPWYLLTQEAFEGYRRLLKPEGIFIANMILGTDDAPASTRFRSNVATTMKTAFRWTTAIELPNDVGANHLANVLIFAGNGEEPDREKLRELVAKGVRNPRADFLPFPADGKAYTDDHGAADYESLAMYREAGFGD